MIKEYKTETTVEKQILTAFIVSNELLHDFAEITKPEYFESSYIREVVRWTIEYYNHHKKAPRTYIQNIFDYKVADSQIDEVKAQLIELMLTELSVQFEVQHEINVDYHAGIVEEFYRRREIELTVSHVRNLITDGRTSDAELVLSGYHKVARKLIDFVNPFDEDVIKETFKERSEDFFKFPGHLGDFLGGFDRGWLVGLSGPFKRGKTWYAQEFAVQGILSDRKVMFFSLEMSKKQMNERLYKRLTATGNKRKKHRYPIFDCKYNQDGSCLRPERVDTGTLYEEGKWRPLPPRFNSEMRYRPCSVCRQNGELDRFYYPAIWYEERNRPKYEQRRIGLKLKNLRMYSSYIKYKCYPRFSANISDIRQDILKAEHFENFIPDIIVIDYADILKPEDGIIDGFQKEDRTWIALSQLAMERNALVVTPTQVSKTGQDAKQQSAKHQARWVGKLGHVDIMLALNQTEDEHKCGLMRVSTIAHRHEAFTPSHNCLVLQNLDVGQPHLDSEIQRYEEDNED